MKTRNYRRGLSCIDNASCKASQEEYPEYLQLWIIRILWNLGGHREFIYRNGFSNDAVSIAIGLGEWDDTPETDSEKIKLNRDRLRELYTSKIDSLNPVLSHKILGSNITDVANLVCLSETDCRLLEFSILLQTEHVLVRAVECLGDLSLAKTFHALSIILDLPLELVKAALKNSSVLQRTGLVSISNKGVDTLDCKLDVISSSFSDLAISDVMNPVDLLRGQLNRATSPDLALKDYKHLVKHLRVIVPYLRHVKVSRRCGVNILIYGQPGTGKSQLVKVLAKYLRSDLFEVASEDEDGEIVQGHDRLQTYRAALAFLSNRDTFLAFEEIEDIFPDTSAFYFGASHKHTNGMNKALINRMLEENTVPTFWISNSVLSLDPAYTRRFDFVIEMPVPPRKQRERIIKNACGGLVSNKFVNRLAESEMIAPAVITRVASVVRCIKNELPAEAVSESIEMMVESTLKAQGHHVKIGCMANQLPTCYDPAYINTAINLNELASGLKMNQSCRMCLYGPPGTGKTAYGYWLAKTLDMPIITKRVSDLQSPYLGEAEMNIASAFKQATLDESILLIDEVDSFLQDRRSADKSWEVSQVNEFLTQLENFSGIFIASTNLMDGLDQAAMRRFDIKARFDYLKSEQAWQLFRKQCKLQSIPTRKKGLRKKLDRLTVLTPGDFAVITRSDRFDPIKDAWQMIERLEKECSLKDTGHTSIGFM